SKTEDNALPFDTDNKTGFENGRFQNNFDMYGTLKFDKNKSVAFEPDESLVPEKSNKQNNLNKDITDILEELAKKEEAVGDFYRERAYRAAIKSVEAYPKKIESGKEARKLKFIGPSIEAKINEILEMGTCSYKSGYPDSVERQIFNVMIKIPRIGRANAIKFMMKGYKTVEELIDDPDLQPDQKYMIEYRKELDKKIPRWEMKLIHKYIYLTLKQLDDRYLAETCGSFRRGAEFSESLNIVISHPDLKDDNATENNDNFLKKLIYDLTNQGFCTDSFLMEPYKYLAICRIPPLNPKARPYLRRKIEMRAVSYERYWLTILAKTGDQTFYKSLQKRAHERGFKLSDTILAPIEQNNVVGKPLKVNSEDDIFRILNTKYLAPKDRDWRNP
ncbi:6884_t:CDS:2, partial [Funneliformis geosporum]